MSNSTIKTQNQQSKPIKNIEVGKFYLIHDGSPSGHPGLIIWKDDNANLYLAIKFGTTSNKENTEFKYPIGQNTGKSYYYKRLFLRKRKDFGSNELTQLSIQSDDIKVLIGTMNYLNPVYSKNIKSNSKHLYKLIIKNVTDRP